MSIPNIEYTEFKELEGKLNTYLCMVFNDSVNDIEISVKDLSQFIERQTISEREKIHLAISAMLTINKLNEKRGLYNIRQRLGIT